MQKKRLSTNRSDKINLKTQKANKAQLIGFQIIRRLNQDQSQLNIQVEVEHSY